MLQPWLEIAQPRRDIADGSFDESLFAADLGLVARGTGPVDYLDPRAFCEKTYLTANLRTVLMELGSRLAGDPSAPGVYRLQTEFGGGKTHTLLAAYHVFGTPSEIAGTELAKELAPELPGSEIPAARVVVLDGSALKVGEPEITDDGAELHSLLGHLAYGLGGKEQWQRVAAQDQRLAGSSTAELAKLLEAHAPCLILLDETLEYLNKGLTVPAGDGNLASTTLTFVKELTSAAANTPRVALLATLTSSRMEDYAEVAGQEMQERLSKVVGRSENIVTPVEGDDIFPILHRRLFIGVGTEKQRREVADAYAKYYAELGDALPDSYTEETYRSRIAAAYPFHPELVDILTNRWGSLSGFQRTRGALRTLAHTVKALAQRQHPGAIIHPGDVPLGDAGVRAEVLKFAGESYKAALNADVIRTDSKAPEEDRRRGGVIEQHHIATALATTAFLDSFGPDKVVGASAAQLLLGAGRPGLSRGNLDDVRDALEGILWYMRLEGGRYRFTTEPNLNKVVLEREAAIPDSRIEQLVREAIGKVAGDEGPLRCIPWIHESVDLPDDSRLTLGVLDFYWRIGAESTSDAVRHAQEIVEHRGSSFRTNKNSAMLVIADAPALAKTRQTARTLAALRDLKADKHRLNRFNAEQKEQLHKRLVSSEDRLPQQTVMAYRHLALLGGADGTTVLDRIDLGPAKAGATVPTRVLEHLRSVDRLIDKLAPAALLSARFGLLPEGSDAIELDTLIGYFTQLTRLPKLAGPDVLRECLAAGVSQSLFGLASGSDWRADDAVLRFGSTVDRTEIEFQPGTWLIRASKMSELIAAHPTEESTMPVSEPTANAGEGATSGRESGPVATPSSQTTIRRVNVALKDVPADKARDVIKVAILPLGANSATTKFDIVITADGGTAGIPRETLDLVVLEGLRQLGLDPEVHQE